MNRNIIICRSILENPSITQRELALALDISLGSANNLMKECIAGELIAQDSEAGIYKLLPKGLALLEENKVDGALIIAAGFGSRFVPLTFEMPKGLLEVFGERMIERQIRQLHEVGVNDITIVVGYLKEKFEYLIDKYHVKLLYNPEYSCKNTLATIYHARDVLRGRNMYVLASDNWMRHNMYHAYEGGAWYSSSYMKGDTSEWCLDFNKKGKILNVSVGGRDKWVMYGPAYFSKDFSADFLPVLEAYYGLPGTEQFYWENVLLEMLSGEAAKRLEHTDRTKRAAQINHVNQANHTGQTNHTDQVNHKGPQHQQNNGSDSSSASHIFEDITIYINRRPEDEVYEFENLEELRQFDVKYQRHSDNEAMELVSAVFHVPESEITEIRCLKSGMTNKSFLFNVKDKHYICRIPGPGTELLINRKQEKAVYDVVAGLGITEKIIYFDGETGYKIAEFYDGARNCDPHNWVEMEKCMAIVRQLHGSGLTVDHSFDLRERIDFYEKLCRSHGDILFEDYGKVHGWMMELLDQLDRMGRPKVLSHLDANGDNFLMLEDDSARLIDWEYAGMCDPLVDVAMCAIYSYYNDEETERLIRIYLEREPSDQERYSIYAHMALGGFLWSLWAVYKAALGEEFGEYTIIMYRYAKHYYKKCQEIGKTDFSIFCHL